MGSSGEIEGQNKCHDMCQDTAQSPVHIAVQLVGFLEILSQAMDFMCE